MEAISALILLTVFTSACWNPVVFGADDASNDVNSALCGVDLRPFLPLPYNTLPNIVCKPLWNSFFLRYSRTADNIFTIVLSAPYTTGWVGMGLSKDGMMLNSSAMVGWINENGLARIKQYYLAGFTPSQVKPDKGELPLTSVPPFVTVYGATIYLAFQLNAPVSSLTSQAILLAYSTRYPNHHRLTPHNDKTTIRFDFAAGNVGSVSSSGARGASDIFRTIRTHGILGLLGWGLILPVGAIVARHLKHRDPLWYELHVAIQFIGFIIGVAAVAVGRSLYDRIHANSPTHRGIGIFVLVLSILQVLAFFLRPDKDSKNRRIWNLYHQWFGRIALFFGALNIVLGIQYANAGNEWRLGYGFLLAIILLTCIVLEALLKLRKAKEAHSPPDFQMNSL
ncbi:hypothetical protein DCAR_0729004 [Daucus carota subsp. sativus]|uniref:Uncharacterized protein n=1 Tax=Daucus carota subsp. sativus TaxID=79200 RepID=A0A164TYS8_DAUCS|nr:PREDICTED: cytochrome b561 and DOMON domain-containing protein At3g61750-like [Daucus carota subsp. sativus]WOH09547.1 hypothetical protein DCAR_0729004 [Daucus carota subsp. sativus]